MSSPALGSSPSRRREMDVMKLMMSNFQVETVRLQPLRSMNTSAAGGGQHKRFYGQIRGSKGQPIRGGSLAGRFRSLSTV